MIGGRAKLGALTMRLSFPLTMPAVPAFSQQQLEVIAKLVGDLLTGSEITRVLQQAEVYKDVTPDDTKWKRLLTAFALQQRQGPGVLSKCTRCPLRLTRRSGSLTWPTRVASRS